MSLNKILKLARLLPIVSLAHSSHAKTLEFKRLGPTPQVSYYGTVALEPRNPEQLYFATRGATSKGRAKDAGLYQSSDGGKNWKHFPKVAPSVNYGNVGVKIHPKHPETVVAVCEYQPNFSITTDGGKTWTTQNAPYKHGISIALDPRDPYVIFVGSDDGVWKTSDQGKTWKSLTNGLPKFQKTVSNTATDLLIDPTSPDTIYVGFLYAALDEPWGVYKSTDAGESWKACNEGLPTDSLEIDLGKAQLKNADGSKAKGKMATPMLLKLQHRAIECMAMDPNNPQTLYANTRQKGIFRTTNGGETWENISIPRFDQEYTKTGAKVMGLLVHPKKPGLLIASTDRLSIFLSRDHGDTWSEAGNLIDAKKAEGKMTYVLPNEESFSGNTLDSPRHTGRMRLFTPALDPKDENALLISGDLGLFRVTIPGLLE